jgi:hypothetical protein
MGWRSTLIGALAVGAVGFTAGRVFSQDAAKEMTEEEKMKVFQEMMAPTEEHKQLAARAGAWDYEMTWFEPNKEPQKAKGVATYESALNGLYLTGTHKGDMGGMPFEGHGVEGFSKDKKKFFSFWYDGYGTTPMLLWGVADGKTVTYDGDLYECPMGNHTPRFKVTRDDADHMTFEYWMKAEGKTDYVKGMEIHSTRRGAAKAEAPK